MSNKAIAENYFQAITKGDVAGALACFGPGAEFSSPMGPLPFPDGVRGMLAGYDESFPGARFEINNTIEAGDQLVIEGVWIGKHTGPMTLPDGRKLPATNREVRAPFVTVFQVRGGKIASHRGYWDLASFMAQIS